MESGDYFTQFKISVLDLFKYDPELVLNTPTIFKELMEKTSVGSKEYIQNCVGKKNIDMEFFNKRLRAWFSALMRQTYLTKVSNKGEVPSRYKLNYSKDEVAEYLENHIRENQTRQKKRKRESEVSSKEEYLADIADLLSILKETKGKVERRSIQKKIREILGKFQCLSLGDQSDQSMKKMKIFVNELEKETSQVGRTVIKGEARKEYVNYMAVKRQLRNL